MTSINERLDLSKVDSECDLVVHFQCNSPFDMHLSGICAEASRTGCLLMFMFICLCDDMLVFLSNPLWD